MRHALFAMAVCVSAGSASAQLFGSDNFGNYFLVDEATGAATIITNDDSTYNFMGGATEIEIDPATGVGYAQNPGSTFMGNLFDGATGASLSGSVPTIGAFAGLEYVGGDLYGTYHTNAGGPSTLAILDPTTGVQTDIGATGVGPINGLAYDASSGVLYGSTARNALGPTSWLVRVDLGTGVASPIGDMGIVAGSIEFGSNGLLYAGGGAQDQGNIFTIDPATGASTLIGATGLGTVVTGLTLLPAPSSLTLLGAGGLIASRRRRR